MDVEFSGVWGLGVVLALWKAMTPDKASDTPATTRIMVAGIRAGSKKANPGVKRANAHANAAQQTAIAGGGILRSSVDIVLRANAWIKPARVTEPATWQA